MADDDHLRQALAENDRRGCPFCESNRLDVIEKNAHLTFTDEDAGKLEVLVSICRHCGFVRFNSRSIVQERVENPYRGGPWGTEPL